MVGLLYNHPIQINETAQYLLTFQKHKHKSVRNDVFCKLSAVAEAASVT